MLRNPTARCFLVVDLAQLRRRFVVHHVDSRVHSRFRIMGDDILAMGQVHIDIHTELLVFLAMDGDMDLLQTRMELGQAAKNNYQACGLPASFKYYLRD